MNTEPTLSDYVAIIRRRSSLVLLCVLLSLGVSLLWSTLRTPQYRSTARVLLNQITATDGFSSPDLDPDGEALVIESRLVSDVVASEFGTPSEASAVASDNTDVIVITAVSEDPIRARDIAQAYATTYVDVRRQLREDDLDRAAESLQVRIVQLEQELVATPEDERQDLSKLQDELVDQYNRWTIERDIGSTPVHILDEANIPDAPFAPSTARNLLLGGLFGIFAGVAASLLIDSLDRRAFSRATVEPILDGTPVLAAVPTIRGRGASAPFPDHLEALRSAYEYASLERSLEVVLVTSPRIGAGKTSTAISLATALAESGRSVILVDGDLRRPGLHEAFGLERSPGLTSAVASESALTSAVHHQIVGTGSIGVVPSGPLPLRPLEVLRSTQMRAVISKLTLACDVVIVDSPPVLHAADAIALSRIVDGTILIVDARRTTTTDLRRTYEMLISAGGDVDGTILNHAKGSVLEDYRYEDPSQTARGLRSWRTR